MGVDISISAISGHSFALFYAARHGSITQRSGGGTISR